MSESTMSLGGQPVAALYGDGPKSPRSGAVELRRTAPVKVWAAVGGALLVFEGYVLVKWVTGPYFKRVPSGPDSPPGWMKAAINSSQVVMPVAAIILLAIFLVRPWWTERRVTFDGMACLAALTVSIYDPASCYLREWFSYNSYFFNRGSPMQGIPGWLPATAPGRSVAFPMILVVPAYVVVVFGAMLLVSAFLGSIRSRWPTLSSATLVVLAYLAAVVFDLLIESVVFMRLGFYAETGVSVVGTGHYYEMPLGNLVLAPLMFCALGCLRFFRNDRGQTVVERGAEHFATPRNAAVMRLLAVVAAVQVIVFATYHVPAAVWMGAHAGQPPRDIQSRSYFDDGRVVQPARG